MAAQQTLSSRSLYFCQPYQRQEGSCTMPLGLGPSAGVTVGNLLHSLGMAGKHPPEVECWMKGYLQVKFFLQVLNKSLHHFRELGVKQKYFGKPPQPFSLFCISGLPEHGILLCWMLGLRVQAWQHCCCVCAPCSWHLELALHAGLLLG